MNKKILITSVKIQYQLLIEKTRQCVNYSFGIDVFARGFMPIEKM